MWKLNLMPNSADPLQKLKILRSKYFCLIKQIS